MAYHNNGVMVEDLKILNNLWDREKNDAVGLDPHIVPINSNKEVFWKCPNGHSWKESVSAVNGRKTKCFYCSGRLVWPGENDLKTLYPKIASEWDVDMNGITPDNISPKDTKTYWWKCKNGHPSFPRSVSHRIERHDTCPYCSGKKAIPGVNDLLTLFPQIAAEWDYESNDDISPTDISPNSWKPFNWICPKGHHYSMKVHLRTHSTKSIDCPKCVKAHSTSFPEQAFFYYTKQFYPEAINRYKGLTKTGLELDIFIPKRKIGIEYDGGFSHSSKEAKTREHNKYEICKEKNIRLIRIREGTSKEAFTVDADKVFYIKKRPNNQEMDGFLKVFFEYLIKEDYPKEVLSLNPVVERNGVYYGLRVDINIKRDRPKILEYLIDIDNSFGNLYPELAKNWDKVSNKKLTPYMLPPGSNYPATFVCERCGRKWSAPISNVTSAKRVLCKKCSMSENGLKTTIRAIKEKGSLGDNHPELVKDWDSDANGLLTPFDIPSGYSKDVSWKCSVCGYKWVLSPNARIHKRGTSGCPHCSGRVAMAGVDDLETLFPNIAKEWDYKKNGDVLPSDIRPHSGTKRFWICSKHNIPFTATPHNRLNGGGCSMCKSEKIRNKNGFKIEQYTKDLTYVQTFSSINEAGRALNISPEAIRQAALTGALSANFYWKYEGQEFGKLKPDKKHQIIGINVKTGERLEFESAREAERVTGAGHTKIMKCCNKEPKYKTAKGYYWYFKDSNEEPIVNIQLDLFDTDNE